MRLQILKNRTPNKNAIGKPLAVSLLLVVGTFSSNVGASSISPPPMDIQDINDVNMAGGTPTFTVNDLSIGSGELTLKHSVSSHAGYFYGYHDSFSAGAYHSQIVRGQTTDIIDVVLVSLDGASKTFKIESDGTYTDMKEMGDTLVDLGGNKKLFTRRDGTQAYYDGLFAEKIIYPNGFTVEINRSGYRLKSVTSNNGLHLEWYYSSNQAPVLQQGTQQQCIPYVFETCNDSTPEDDDYYRRIYEEELYDYSFPTHIKAINRAFEYCDPDSNVGCTVPGTWPQSSYEWDPDMPYAIWEGPTDFSVTTMTGGKTVYEHNAFDTSPNADEGVSFIPRVVRVRDGSSSTGIVASYYYENRTNCTLTPLFGVYCTTASPAVLKRVEKPGQTWLYTIGENGNYQIASSATGPGSVQVINSAQFGVPVSVGSNGMNFKFEWNDRNRLTETSRGLFKSKYYHDSRGNIVRREDIGAASTAQAGQTIEVTAGYPATCTNTKTCNQPIWTKDGNGNQTDYMYHDQSGMVKRVTRPAGAGGVRPQTRYKYQQFYARYKKNGNTIETADTPIWLKTEESFCIKGAARASAQGGADLDGCVLGTSDEVKMTYKYGPSSGPNNLFLTEVETHSNGQVQRTCYEYDRYGNMIGETKPKGAVGGCS